MSRGYLTTALLVALPALMLPVLPVVAAQVDSTDLARCHAIAGRDERLNCYEALTEAALTAAATAPVHSGASGQAAQSAGASSALTSLGPTAAVANSAPGASAAGNPAAGAPGAGPSAAGNPGAATPGASAPPSHPVDPNDPANFGLSRHQLEAHAASAGPASIKSEVEQITENRQHKVTVLLDNGQTWVFIEPDARLRPGDTVTIKHASLGSFLMLTPSRRSYRVERLK